ncbi:MAG: type II secretion system minor pseudopilin GspH [Pseudomonadales bacterium]|nr:type II secretion system minor pseudopilin GspH [Pseudomonadales bacterium]
MSRPSNLPGNPQGTCAGDATRKAQRAFTLIEVLVVLFIVSLMTGIVVANLPSFVRTGDFDEEAARLYTLLTMARDEAIIQSSELGFKPTRSGYEFLIYDEIAQAWEPFDVRPFQTRQLPAGMKLELFVEQSDFIPASDDEDEEDGLGKGPPVLLTSSGETTPFELTLSDDDDELSRTLETDGFSDLRWQDESEDEQ